MPPHPASKPPELRPVVKSIRPDAVERAPRVAHQPPADPTDDTTPPTHGLATVLALGGIIVLVLIALVLIIVVLWLS